MVGVPGKFVAPGTVGNAGRFGRGTLTALAGAAVVDGTDGVSGNAGTPGVVRVDGVIGLVGAVGAVGAVGLVKAVGLADVIGAAEPCPTFDGIGCDINPVFDAPDKQDSRHFHSAGEDAGGFDPRLL